MSGFSRRRHALTWAAFAALASAIATSLPASAQVDVARVDFDGNVPQYSYGYTYAGFGDSNFAPVDFAGFTNFTAAVTNAGRNGTAGLVVTGNFAGLVGQPTTFTPTYNYHGFGGGFGSGRPPGLPSPNMADYTAQIDLGAAGISGSANAELQLQLRLPDDTLFIDADTNEEDFGQIVFPLQLTAAFATHTFTDLGTGTWKFENAAANVPVGERDFAKYYDRITINYNVNVDATLPFGQDDNNQLLIDNFLFTAAVPEPASMLLLAPAAAMALGRRRRR